MTVHRSRIKGIMIIGWVSDTLFDVCFVVSCALLPRRFQKPSVFSIWRRSDRYGARTARAFVSRETIVSVTLNMLISLLKDRFRLSKRRQNLSYTAASETGFLTAKKLCQSILAFKGGHILLTRKKRWRRRL